MGTGSGTNYSTTNNLGLRLPTPGVCGALGVEPAGTSWMELLNGSLSTVDAHNHAPGFGAQVPSSGLNINADVSWGSNNLTALRSARFGAISLGSLGSSDLGCLLVSGADLYFVDTAGNQVRITSGGAVAGTPGAIGGLVSPAAATYTSASKLFSLTSSSGFAANLSCGPVSVTDAQNSGGKAATLQVPSGLAANYNLTLPAALPGSLSLLSLTSGGVVGTFAGIGISGGNLTLPGNLTVAGSLSGVTSLAMGGALTGVTTIAASGAVSVGGQISGVTDPTTAQMAATKNYVDTFGSGFTWTSLSNGASWLGGNFIKVGQWVKLAGQPFVNSGSNATIGTLPVGSRPSATGQGIFACYGQTSGGVTNATVWVNVNSSGVVSVVGASSGTGHALNDVVDLGNIVFPVN